MQKDLKIKTDFETEQMTKKLDSLPKSTPTGQYFSIFTN
jgi:hypothetical protein